MKATGVFLTTVKKGEDMAELKYKRPVLLKLSGEALAEENR